MANQDLRIFSNNTTPNHDVRQDGVAVTLGEVFPVLADALIHERSWLHDFASEQIVISQDLHEILAAYSRLQRRKAG